jgi:hypothetical protein
MQIYPRGVIVFAVFCVLLAAALSDPTWMAIGSAVATIFVALALGGLFFPSFLRRTRGL